MCIIWPTRCAINDLSFNPNQILSKNAAAYSTRPAHTTLNFKSWYTWEALAQVQYAKVLTLLNGTVQNKLGIVCVQYNFKLTSVK